MSKISWTDLPEEIRQDVVALCPLIHSVEIVDGEITYFFKDDTSDPCSLREFKKGSPTYLQLLDVAILLDGYVFRSGYDEC